VILEGERAVGVVIQLEDGTTQEVRAKVVVDASGQSGLLMNKFKLRVWDPVLNKGAVWTYWRGAYRDTGKNEGATSVLQLENRQGWFWYIPLHDNRVSVGVVAPFDYVFGGRSDHETIYNEELDKCAAVKQRIEGAERITGYFATRDYSYRAKEVAGEGWVMIGDAFGFLDPLYSSGVLLALKSGEMAADAITEGLAKGDTSAAQLGQWGPTLNDGIDRMRRLVCEYYDGFSFGNFMRQHPEMRGTVTDLLIGDLFTDKVDKVWEPMKSMYPHDKKREPTSWSDGTPQEAALTKQNDLYLPSGPRV
jgi:flavin-dependent dehydrogenase